MATRSPRIPPQRKARQMSPSPRDLDPKFTKTTPPEDDSTRTNRNQKTESVTQDATEDANPRVNHLGQVDTEVPAHLSNEVSQITYVQRFTGQDGKPAEVV